MANLWKFTDNQGTFRFDSPEKITALYFPLCSNCLLSSITPTLHGDIKTNQDSFLLQPVCREDLHNLKSNRNFWLIFKKGSAVSITEEPTNKDDEVFLEAGILWHKIIRVNKTIGFKAEILNFVPAPDKNFEIMSVRISNIKRNPLRFTPLAAIPIYARSAENLRDHRHVTSLLNRIRVTPLGVVVRPAIKFDERRHRINHTTYFVFGFDGKDASPKEIFPTVENFIGEGGSFQRPAAVFEGSRPLKTNINGKEAMAAFKFSSITLKKNEDTQYILLMGIAPDPEDAERIQKNYCTTGCIEDLFKKTIHHWQEKSSTISISSGDRNFDNWFRWVSIQPTLRKLYGCSFLPDFDYGKGGRGWRDLWQDALSLILTNGEGIREMLTQNFAGVRIDGSNATIIQKNPYEFTSLEKDAGTGFIADRNQITRVWMDHGIWPFFTLEFYINQTKDIKILFEETTYFSDLQTWRGKKKNLSWTEKNGNLLRTKEGKIYKGSILEHILLQHLVQFFNVGPNNNIRLENADWNDALDMAPERGEGVAFSCFYARNLKKIARLLQHIGIEKINLFEEISALLDTLSAKINYDNAREKNMLLENYFRSIESGITGRKKEFQIKDLSSDLHIKADWISRHIRKNEWLNAGFFNGYYDNDSNRVEGRINNKIRMTLTGQVFPILSDIADKKQIKSILTNVEKHLKDKKTGGIRLNTDFQEDYLKLGRAFSFVYGDKENGSIFSHMNVMYVFALYRKGFVEEGFEILNSLYKMSVNSAVSKIYPNLPEYFNLEGRGMYSYLTGSASWYVLTYICEVFGVKGEMGDLVIEPKLLKKQFDRNKTIGLKIRFAGRNLYIKFKNEKLLNWNEYKIKEAKILDKSIILTEKSPHLVIPREKLLKLTQEKILNEIIVVLG